MATKDGDRNTEKVKMSLADGDNLEDVVTEADEDTNSKEMLSAILAEPRRIKNYHQYKIDSCNPLQITI